ncbi:MAG: hypothetical protein K2Y32_00205 [Candidatus Obscuribacterales bacterium]|nr:hypothetical protein [Candidatus Obscuribacterales bacterium]
MLAKPRKVLNRKAAHAYARKSLCPFCESETFEDIGEYQFAEDAFYHSVLCGECGKQWSAIYRLVGVLAGNTSQDAAYISKKHADFAKHSHE